MKIGIYGGTFNPIHRGHMEAARSAAAVLGIEKLILIPAGLPPHKQLTEDSAPGADRLAMTVIAADRLKLSIPVEVSDMELKRKGKSYTSDTLKQLKEKYPDDELWLFMGTDMFLTLHQWHEPEVILSCANICAFGREAGDVEARFAPQKDYLEKTYRGAKIVTITLPGLIEVSSTELRARLAAGEMPEELDESVYGYILRSHLYGVRYDLTKLDYPRLRAASYSMLAKGKRIPHVRGCEEEAVKLARRWGVDEDKARTAAILHDCTKYLNRKEHLAICDKADFPLDKVERHSVKLLHSKSGAVVARTVFGVSEDVMNGIQWHTTGKADMTRLEKIIYIADYMEPTRDFDGVEKLRALVYEDLDAAVLLGLTMSVEEVTGYGEVPHYRTVEARDWLRARLK